MSELTVEAEPLRQLAESLLAAVGVPKPHATVVVAALLDADIEGVSSHGLMLLPMYLDRISAGSVSPTAEGRIVADTGSQVVIDAENALGQVTAERATDLSTTRARQHGLAAVAVRNAFHFGAAGRYARAMAGQGCVGLVMANTRPLMPAPGGAERVVGNNPLAVGVPTDGEPIVVDLALSAAAMGKIRLAASRGEPIPEGWACSADGLPTTNAKEAISGMLLPAAGAKGFGLAVMIDLLAGGLSSGGIGDEVLPLYGDMARPYGSSHLFVAFDITGFRPLEEFKAATAAFAHKVRASRPAPGGAAVRMPGDRAAAAHLQFQGRCCIASSTREALRAAAARLGVATPPELSS